MWAWAFPQVWDLSSVPPAISVPALRCFAALLFPSPAAVSAVPQTPETPPAPHKTYLLFPSLPPLPPYATSRRHTTVPRRRQYGSSGHPQTHSPGLPVLVQTVPSTAYLQPYPADPPPAAPKAVSAFPPANQRQTLPLQIVMSLKNRFSSYSATCPLLSL